MYVAVDAILALTGVRDPDHSPVGIGIAIASLIVMPVLAWFEFRTGRELRSKSVQADAKQLLLCIYLSGTVLIAEAGYRSGSLHTAARAIELGRPVGAIPGPLTSAASAGCHRLMRDGLGSIITGYDDVRELLHGVREGAHRAVRERAGLEANPLDQQSPGPWRIPQSPGL